jgi:hypothetical protein
VNGCVRVAQVLVAIEAEHAEPQFASTKKPVLSKVEGAA